MDIDDPGERRPFLIPVAKFSPKNRGTTNADADLHGGQERSNLLQNPGVGFWGVIESRSVDKGHYSPVESELVGKLDLDSTRLQPRPNP